jgi:predicted nucleic acid-binding protein
MIVVDASSALRAALRSRGFADLVAHQPVGPPLLWSEGMSAIRQAVWRGEITNSVGSEALARFLAAPVERRAPRKLYDRAWQIAVQLGWAKTYDAEYVALAQVLRCPLLTRDQRLARRVQNMVEIISPSDL